MRQRYLFIIIFVLGLGVSAKYFADFVHQETLRGSLHASLHSTIVLVLLLSFAVLLQVVGHILRAYKSSFLLDSIRKSNFSTLFQGLSIGYLFNTLLPFRLGEVVRAVYIGDALAISRTAVFMSIVIERIVDSFILSLSFLAAGIAIHPVSSAASSLMVKIAVSILILSLILSLIIMIIRSENDWLLRLVRNITEIFNDKYRDRGRFVAWSGIYGTRLMLDNRKMFRKYIGVSVIMWLFYFSSSACVALAFLPHIANGKLWYAIQSSYVGVSAPAGPGYLGTFHLIVSRLLTDINLHDVEVFSIFAWVIIITPISLVGLFVLIRKRYHLTEPVSHREMLINKLYREKDISSELSHFLDAYFKCEQINQVLTQAELENKFKLIKSFKGGSNAHTMLVWQKEELRVKKITLPQYANKLQVQAQWLQERSTIPHLPRVIEEEKTANYYYFDLAYLEDYVPFFEYIHSNSSAANNKIIEQVIGFVRKHIYNEKPSVDNAEKLNAYIESKMIGKINDTAAVNNELSRIIAYKKLIINGKSYLNLFQAIEKLKTMEPALRDLSTYKESVIHGDLTIDNIIASSSGDFLLLDPNNENQVSTPVVDYGKIYQSLHSGYEFLIQLDQCDANDNVINFEDAKSQKYAEMYVYLDSKLKSELNQAEYRSILFHESVHYCRMLTYRANINAATLPVFYAVAVKTLNEFLDQYA